MILPCVAATKLVLDLAATRWRGHGMTDPELVATLCIRIGMIMEDVCGEAVMARADREQDLCATVARLGMASERISRLVQAAAALSESPTLDDR